MVQGFYTLEEASQILKMTTEELNRMAQKREIRAFADRGTWRFRTQDVEELARRRGLSTEEIKTSDPNKPKTGLKRKSDLKPGQAPAEGSGKHPKPKSGLKTGPAKKTDSGSRLVAESDVPDFNFTDETITGAAPPPPSGPTSGKIKRKTELPSQGRQDSGVRLVPGGDDDDVEIDFDVSAKLEDSLVQVAGKPPQSPEKGGSTPAGPASGRHPRPDLPGAAGPKSGRHSRLDAPGVSGPGSGRQQRSGIRPVPSQEALVTEEFDLGIPPPPPKPSTKLKPGKGPDLPTSSPFELSESDLQLPDVPASGPGGVGAPADSKEAFHLDLDDDQGEVELGSLGSVADRSGRAEMSGINLQDPADSGISLEPGAAEDQVEFELSLDDAGGEPKTGEGLQKEHPSSSEFELSLDDDSAAASSNQPGSDSEFELTLDDQGGLVAADEEAVSEGEAEGEKDIFETDFDLPALDDESGSQAVALEESDTDLESSDFDLALGDEDLTADDSGSQVVALDEDEAEEGAATVARPRNQIPALGDEDEEEAVTAADEDEDAVAAADEDEEEAVADEEEEDDLRPVAVAAPASWGVFAPVSMVFCLGVTLVAALMAFELLHGMWGYHQNYKTTGFVVRSLADMFTDGLPKE